MRKQNIWRYGHFEVYEEVRIANCGGLESAAM